MEKTRLTWMDFYREFATKILSYKSERNALIEKLKRVYEKIGIRFPKMEADGSIIDLDPFTVLGMFNKGITENNRKLIISGLKSEFDIQAQVPEDFDGIPVLNNQKATFFHFINDRKLEDIDNLWDVFEAAIGYAENKTAENKAEFAEKFDKVLKNKGVRWNITMGLFWIRPDCFINLDSKNRDFILAERVLSENLINEIEKFKDVPKGETYLKICEELKKYIEKNNERYTSFAEFSSAAWNTKDIIIQPVTSKNEPKYWPSIEEYNPKLGIGDWIDFLKEDRKTYPSTFRMLEAMIELGGEATCKSIGELLGEHASAWVSRGNNLGKRMKAKHNLPPCMDGEKERFFPIAFIGREVVESGKTHYAWKIRPELEKAVINLIGDKEGFVEEMKTDIGKNTILYGPPGTGKTYNTVVYAVAIIENKKLQAIKDEDYSDVLARYNEYKEQGLIEFTTFHQSYGYEEFIEGIKPELAEDGSGNINYSVNPGVFKQFCEKALIKRDEFEIAWIKLIKQAICNDRKYEFTRRTGTRISAELLEDDETFIVQWSGNTSNKLTKSKILAQWQIEDESYRETLSNGGAKWMYDANQAVLDVMTNLYGLKKGNNNNHVFIIDEINRGNISKIFGELITLIESTKRIGQEEEVKVRLPYSQQLFGVPDNVYLIGTMNTADRSIATIDTALRRRFKFKEMLPNADVLEGIVVDDVDIKEMFIKMNKRISVLFDREHTLGHAYFLPLRTEPTFEKLSEIFKDNIIPLLQEYFFEDYEKIRLVLGDNSKESRENQFIVEEENKYDELFGETDYGFDDEKHYMINEEAFGNIEAYKLI